MIEELRTFCTAADVGSLGRAARRLHVSQPALTKRLHALEARAGAELLERGSRGVSLTPAGLLLYPEAQRLLAQAEIVEELLAGLRHETSPVRVAASHTAAESLMPPSLSGVELVAANSSIVREMVSEGRADVGVAAACHGPDRSGLRSEPLAEDEVVCAVSVSHPWARTGRVSLAEFLRTPMVVRDRSADSRATVDEVLAARGLHAAPPLCEAGTTVAAKAAARELHAPLLLSERALTGHGLVRVDPGGLRFTRTFCVLLPAQGEPRPEVSAFVQALRDTSARATSASDAAPTA